VVTNVEFRLGEIEHLPVADAAVDVVISNCVVNLATDKPAVFREAYRVLKTGGRLAIADMVAREPLPDAARADAALITGCLGGAITVEEIESATSTSSSVPSRTVPLTKWMRETSRISSPRPPSKQTSVDDSISRTEGAPRKE